MTGIECFDKHEVTADFEYSTANERPPSGSVGMVSTDIQQRKIQDEAIDNLDGRMFSRSKQQIKMDGSPRL